jgi:PAS domain S-box-containing protein
VDSPSDLYELLVRGIVDCAIFMLDPEGRVASWNPGAERIKGYRAEEIIGQHFSRFYAPEDRDAGLPGLVLEEARREGRYAAEGWRVRKDGTCFWASVVIDAIHDADDRLIGFAEITRDTTELHDAQLELEQSREQLLQSQKMEAIGQLTGGLAHNFNNLLMGISGSLELLRARIAQGRPGDFDRYITSAQSAASRAAALTQRLLMVARRQPLDSRPTDANRLIAGMTDLLQRTVGPGIRLETKLSTALWPTLCDPNQLETALLNLCINARDAMPDGGNVTIATANRPIVGRGMRNRQDECVAISITDTGTGMSRDVLAHAFEPFFTTKPLGQGTGLGLSMVYGFATQSGGDVRLDSKPGVGTTVRLHLPRHFGAAPTEEAPPRHERLPHVGSGETVLIVDDEPTVRMLMTEVLEELGYAAIEAGDSTAGLKVLESDARIDLLITDIGLPGGLNGLQMAQAAREGRPDLKVLFVTGYAGSAGIGSASLPPSAHVMRKPFAMDRFAAQIKAAIEGT